jgi:uncharacterized membrane protein
MQKKVRDRIRIHLSDGDARVLCYALGPISGALFLRLRQYGGVWSVRFHAFHSILMTGFWALVWSMLRLIEEISPWFLSTVARELRLVVNLGFLVAWAMLLVSAYDGRRFVIVPFVHELAVRLSRKFERRTMVAV